MIIIWKKKYNFDQTTKDVFVNVFAKITMGNLRKK